MKTRKGGVCYGLQERRRQKAEREVRQKKEPPQTNVMAFYYADSDDIPCKET